MSLFKRSSARGKRPTPIGVFGGTFDPVHLGHLRLAEEALDQLELSEVLWIPAGQPPLRDQPHTEPGHRLAMTACAIAGHEAFTLDAGEVFAEVPSYTVHTLERLRAEHGAEQPLVLLLGADAFARLEGWHQWLRLFELAHIAVATRPGYDLTGDLAKVSRCGTALAAEFAQRQATPAALSQSAAGCIVPFAITPLDISATAIRAALAAERSVRYLVSDAVLDYISQNNLYR